MKMKEILRALREGFEAAKTGRTNDPYIKGMDSAFDIAIKCVNFWETFLCK